MALSGPAGHGCGALFLLRPSLRACKKQTAAPAPLRLSRPLDARLVSALSGPAGHLPR